MAAMQIQEVINTINQMQAVGVIERYAIGGAVGATFYPAKILRSKREFRKRLAARPIAEKLAMLDALRERALAIRPTRPASERDALREQPPSCRVQGEKTE